MGRYRIRVATGAWLFSGSYNRVQLWLVGARGEAELELQLRPARGQVSGPPGLGSRRTAVRTRGAGGKCLRDGADWEYGEKGRQRPRPRPGSATPPGGPAPQPPLLPQMAPEPEANWDSRSDGRLPGERGRARLDRKSVV